MLPSVIEPKHSGLEFNNGKSYEVVIRYRPIKPCLSLLHQKATGYKKKIPGKSLINKQTSQPSFAPNTPIKKFIMNLLLEKVHFYFTAAVAGVRVIPEVQQKSSSTSTPAMLTGGTQTSTPLYST